MKIDIEKIQRYLFEIKSRHHEIEELSPKKNGKTKSSPAFRGTKRTIFLRAGQMDFLQSHQS